MNIFSTFLIFILYIHKNTIQTKPNTDSSQLKLVFMVHRHGDRTPIKCYPNDPYSNASNWLDGWGQLTPNGKQRMYSLGKYIRKRYENFLGSSPKEVQIRSSGADRCLESVALLMAGMYRPEGRWQWNQDLGRLWQPFPIQTEPRNSDGMLNPGSDCLAAEQELNRIHNSPKVVKYTQRKKEILEYVSINSGGNVSDLNSAEEVFDTLLIERENKLTLPRWVDSNTYQSLREISDMTFYFDFSTQLIQRLRTGLLLKDILKHMKEMINQNKTIQISNSDCLSKKLFIYSTHDTQLALLLNAFNVFNKKSPPFGSTILIEFFQTKSDYFIKTFYLNDTKSEEPFALNLPNCTHNNSNNNNNNNECLFQRFNQTISDLIPNNWKYECHNRSFVFRESTVISYLFGSLLTLSLLTIIYILYIFLKPKSRGIMYQMLPIR